MIRHAIMIALLTLILGACSQKGEVNLSGEVQLFGGKSL